MAALLVLVVLLGGWQVYTSVSGIDPIIVPSPADVATSLWDDRGLLWSQFLVTAQEIVLGLLLAIAVGLLLSLLLHLSRTLRRAIYPLLIGSQAVPIAIVAPVVVVWLGFDIGPKILIVALVCFFPIVVPTLDALAGAPPGQDRLMRTLGASRWQRLRFAEMPEALPGVFTGAKLSVALAAIAAYLAETSGSTSGLGHLITQALAQLDTARAWAAVFVFGAFSVLLFTTFTVLERRLLPWSHRSQGISS